MFQPSTASVGTQRRGGPSRGRVKRKQAPCAPFQPHPTTGGSDDPTADRQPPAGAARRTSMVCPSRSMELAEDGLLLTNRYSRPPVQNLDHHRAIVCPG